MYTCVVVLIWGGERGANRSVVGIARSSCIIIEEYTEGS